jgi:tetratricopeptide (TPR) repeat protein
MNEVIDGTVEDALRLIEKGCLDQGAAILQRLTAEHPGYHSVQYGMGVVYAFTKKYDDAIQCFKQAVEIFPYFIEAQFNLAVSYQKKLDVGNAIRSYQKVVTIGDTGNRSYMAELLDKLKQGL